MKPMLLLIATALFQAAPGGLQQAWWLTASFEPKEAVVAGIALSSIDPSWVKASVLRDDMLPAAARLPGESVREHGGAFQWIIDLDHDKLPEKALVGVYLAKGGETGRFLLIVGRCKGGPLQKKALLKEPGPPGFSALFLVNGRLRWSRCMECDTLTEVDEGETDWNLKCDS